MYNPFSIADRIILVTGASSGIGRSTAIECSRMGAKLVITGRNEVRLQETLKALEGEGHLAVVADLTNEEQMDRLCGASSCFIWSSQQCGRYGNSSYTIYKT